ncbi:hypothetical protein BRADI_1g67635v3 [Brachypodium distachyon]|uniref:Uncharacterized protein n=1 Tax=Brachypodium distachyon TaxID=15368 RepID=A0A2K2DTV1_BRADI|nr:hypothetical protein BRADI_1g67635v3 [Brachypodium distachyon]
MKSTATLAPIRSAGTNNTWRTKRRSRRALGLAHAASALRRRRQRAPPLFPAASSRWLSRRRYQSRTMRGHLRGGLARVGAVDRGGGGEEGGGVPSRPREGNPSLPGQAVAPPAARRGGADQ